MNTFNWGAQDATNDPEQRGDADGDGQRPGVNREGFDPKYEAKLAPDGNQPTPRPANPDTGPVPLD